MSGFNGTLMFGELGGILGKSGFAGKSSSDSGWVLGDAGINGMEWPGEAAGVWGVDGEAGACGAAGAAGGGNPGGISGFGRGTAPGSCTCIF